MGCFDGVSIQLVCVCDITVPGIAWSVVTGVGCYTDFGSWPTVSFFYRTLGPAFITYARRHFPLIFVDFR